MADKDDIELEIEDVVDEEKAATKEEVDRLDAMGIIHAIRSQDDMQEASGAYKDIETVIANEADLVRVKTRLLPVAVIKG